MDIEETYIAKIYTGYLSMDLAATLNMVNSLQIHRQQHL